jgi:hypothetical protein
VTMNTSGPISLAGSTAGQSIAVELGLGATTQISLQDAAVLGLAAKTAGSAVVMPTDFYGSAKLPKTVIQTPGSGSVTIPHNARHVTIEVWGGGGYSGNGYTDPVPTVYNGGSGGAGGYSKSVYACSGNETVNYTVGGAAAASNATSGTLTITTLTGNGGGSGGNASAGGPGTDAGGGTATGGNTLNTTGAAGSPGAGGTGTTGTYAGPYGTGATGTPGAGYAGDVGAVAFTFTT